MAAETKDDDLGVAYVKLRHPISLQFLLMLSVVVALCVFSFFVFSLQHYVFWKYAFYTKRQNPLPKHWLHLKFLRSMCCRIRQNRCHWDLSHIS